MAKEFLLRRVLSKTYSFETVRGDASGKGGLEIKLKAASTHSGTAMLLIY